VRTRGGIATPTRYLVFLGGIVFILVVGLIASRWLAPSAPSSGVKGSVVYVGGPPDVTVPRSAGPGEVRVYATDGALVGDAHLPDSLTGFFIPVEPGDYRLVVTSGDARCPDQSVTITADRYETVRVRCDVK
jgi:hypothetical protein